MNIGGILCLTLSLVTLGDSKTSRAGWQPILTANVSRATHQNYTYVNGGTSGATVGTYAATIAAKLATLSPDDDPPHVLINLGVNDMYVGLPAEATWVTNYQTILDAVHAKWPTAQLWLMRPWGRNENADADTVAGWIATVQASRSAFTSIGPDERVWLKGNDDGATMTDDGVHYNATGKLQCALQWQAALGITTMTTQYTETTEGIDAGSPVGVGGTVGASVVSGAITAISAFMTEISGTATITTLSGLVSGRMYVLVPAAGSTWKLATGGNIGQTVNAVPGTPIFLVMDGATVRVAVHGSWITPAYAAGDFNASSGSWLVDAGDVGTYAYTLIGKTMTVAFQIATSDVTGAAAALQLTIPAGKVATKRMVNQFLYSDAGAAFVIGTAEVSIGGTRINLYKAGFGGTAWTITAADNTYVFGQITFEVN